MITALRANLGGSLPGFAAQGMTLGAALFPIVIGRDDVLVYMLTVTAPVTIVVHAVILGAQTRLPMAELFLRRSRLASSLSGILLASAAVSVVFLCVAISSTDVGVIKVVLGFFLLLPCQALYLLLLAFATAELEYSKLMWARLVYGAFSFLGTIIMGLVEAPPLAFLAVAALGYVLGVVPVTWKRVSATSLREIAVLSFGFHGFVNELIAARYVIAASLVSGLGSQIGALATPLVPSHLLGSWAAAVRVASGLQTVGGQILGPKLDIGIIAGIRNPGSGLIQRTWARGLGIGASLGVLCVLACGVAVAWLERSFVDSWMALAVAVIGYSATSVFLAPIDRALTLLGGQRERLLWDLARAATGIAVVLFVPASLLLLGLAGLGCGSLVTYLMLLRRRTLAAGV